MSGDNSQRNSRWTERLTGRVGDSKNQRHKADKWRRQLPLTNPFHGNNNKPTDDLGNTNSPRLVNTILQEIARRSLQPRHGEPADTPHTAEGSQDNQEKSNTEPEKSTQQGQSILEEKSADAPHTAEGSQDNQEKSNTEPEKSTGIFEQGKNTEVDKLEMQIREEIRKYSEKVGNIGYVMPEPDMFRCFEMASILDGDDSLQLANDIHEILNKKDAEPEDLYLALYPLNCESNAIDNLNKSFYDKYNKKLSDAIKERFPDDSFGLRLINSEQGIKNIERDKMNLATLKIREVLHLLSDKNKLLTLYEVLHSFKRSTKLLCDLNGRYKHSYRIDLRSDIEAVLKDNPKAKDHALFLIGDDALEEEVMSLSKAVKFQKALANQRFRTKENLLVPVPQFHLRIISAERTHITCEALKGAGYRSKKVIAFSYRFNEKGEKQPHLHIGTRFDADILPIFNLYMATLIQVETTSGIIELVLDPGLSFTPLTIKEWMSKMGYGRPESQGSFELISPDDYKTKLGEERQKNPRAINLVPADQTYALIAPRNASGLPLTPEYMDFILANKPIPDQDTSNYYQNTGKDLLSRNAAQVPYHLMADSVLNVLQVSMNRKNASLPPIPEKEILACLDNLEENFLTHKRIFDTIGSTQDFSKIFPKLYNEFLDNCLAKIPDSSSIIERYERLLSHKHDTGVTSLERYLSKKDYQYFKKTLKLRTELKEEMQRRDKVDKKYNRRKNKITIKIEEYNRKRDIFYIKYFQNRNDLLNETDQIKRAEELQKLDEELANFMKSDEETFAPLDQERETLENIDKEEKQKRRDFDYKQSKKCKDDFHILAEIRRKEIVTDTPWTAKEIQRYQYSLFEQDEYTERELKSKWQKIRRLRDFPIEQVWRLCFDGRYQKNGRPKFDFFDTESETPFLVGTKRLLNAVLGGLDIPGLEFDGHRARKLDALYFQELHDIATAGKYIKIKEGKAKQKFEIGYRGIPGNSDRAKFQWKPGDFSEEGHKELFEKFESRKGGTKIDERYGEAGHPVGNSCLNPYDAEGYYRAKDATWEECVAIAQAIIDKYYEEIEQCITDDEKLTAIVRCCQDLLQAHLFADGNLRTVTFGILTKLLLENDLDPAILHNPDMLSGYSAEEAKNDGIYKGQGTFRALCQPPREGHAVSDLNASSY